MCEHTSRHMPEWLAWARICAGVYVCVCMNLPCMHARSYTHTCTNTCLCTHEGHLSTLRTGVCLCTFARVHAQGRCGSVHVCVRVGCVWRVWTCVCLCMSVGRWAHAGAGGAWAGPGPAARGSSGWCWQWDPRGLHLRGRCRQRPSRDLV